MQATEDDNDIPQHPTPRGRKRPRGGGAGGRRRRRFNVRSVLKPRRILTLAFPLWIMVLLHVIFDFDFNPGSYLSIVLSQPSWHFGSFSTRKRKLYRLLRDVSDLPVNLEEDIPYFWHIDRSGGATMKRLLHCLGLAQTGLIDDMFPDCSNQDSQIRVCDRDFGVAMGIRMINVDTGSLGGIERAVRLKLTQQSFPDIGNRYIVDTSHVYEGLEIFTPRRRGRLFTLLRHPVERAVSKYYYIKTATWEPEYKPEMSTMTLLEFANSELCYENWITRRLVDKMEGDLTREDGELAKKVLQRKTLVLFAEDMAGSLQRIREFFRWDDASLILRGEPLNEERQNCLTTHLFEKPMNTNTHTLLEPGTAEWEAIKAKNMFDLELVAYARELYKEQGSMMERFRTDELDNLLFEAHQQQNQDWQVHDQREDVSPPQLDISTQTQLQTIPQDGTQ